ncbi:hypothetical protein ZWY2020_034826 [Hordeum vulgare]|nr:hypothetical protein ZWY2020_034826 [Hordeum vulgare]
MSDLKLKVLKLISHFTAAESKTLARKFFLPERMVDRLLLEVSRNKKKRWLIYLQGLKQLRVLLDTQGSTKTLQYRTRTGKNSSSAWFDSGVGRDQASLRFG